MRKVILALLLVAIIFCIGLGLALKPVVLSVAEKQLGSVFAGAEVNIGSLEIKPVRRLEFSDIDIKKDPDFAISIKKASFDFTLSSLLKGRILNILLADGLIVIDSTGKSISELNKYFALRPKSPASPAGAGLLIDSIEINKMRFDISSAEVNAKGSISLGIDPAGQEISRIDLVADFVNSFGLSAENISLKAARAPASGILNIAKMKYNKAVIENMQAGVVLKKTALEIGPVSAKIFDGEIKGKISIDLGKGGIYTAGLEFAGLDTGRIIKDFELQNKFTLSGSLDGSLLIEGSSADMKVIDGNFHSNSPGGDLTITDTRYLENMARNSGQSLDILVESFRNYHYNTGKVKLYLDKGNIVFDAALQGEAGKRNLSIVLHDFNLLRRRQ